MAVQPGDVCAKVKGQVVPKFKAGDKVRWGKALGATTSTPIGGIFTVESVNDRGQYTLEFGHGAHAHDVPEAELELIEADNDLRPSAV